MKGHFGVVQQWWSRGYKP